MKDYELIINALCGEIERLVSTMTEENKEEVERMIDKTQKQIDLLEDEELALIDAGLLQETEETKGLERRYPVELTEDQIDLVRVCVKEAVTNYTNNAHTSRTPYIRKFWEDEATDAKRIEEQLEQVQKTLFNY